MAAIDRLPGDPPVRDAPNVAGSRVRILEALRRSGDGLGVQELATEVGLHVNTVRFHLDRLVADGAVARHVEDRTQPGRPRLAFTAVSTAGHPGGARNYRLLAEILAGSLSASMPNPVAAAGEAGHTWGQHLTTRPGPYRHADEDESLQELVRIHNEIGFVPELVESEEGQEIWLRHCPFLEVAEEHRDVVCAVHLGLIRGVLTELRAPLVAGRLSPFVEPSLCVAGLDEVVEEAAPRG